MTLVAVITQPMRMAHCVAYVHEHAADGSAVVIVGDTSAAADSDFPAHTHLTHASPDADLIAPHDFFVQRSRRRLLAWARNGSAAGAWFERTARTLAWRLRYFERMGRLWRTRSAQRHRDDSQGAVDLVRELDRIRSEGTISTIVTFDVFDLPALLGYGNEHGIPVFVR